MNSVAQVSPDKRKFLVNIAALDAAMALLICWAQEIMAQQAQQQTH